MILASWGPQGKGLGALLGRLGGLLGSLEPLGASRGLLGAEGLDFQFPLGLLLGPSWGPLGPSWAPLGPS